MSNHKDENMSDCEDRQTSIPPGQSLYHHQHSASPHSTDHTWRHWEWLEWGWNPQIECLLHKGMTYSVCTVYTMHLHAVSMDNESYTTVMDRHNSMFVPSSCFKCEVEHTDHEGAERDQYHSHAHVAVAEVKALKEDIQHLQNELDEQQKTASSYAATAARWPNRPSMYVKLHVPTPFATARMILAATKQMAHAAPATAMASAPCIACNLEGQGQTQGGTAFAHHGLWILLVIQQQWIWFRGRVWRDLCLWCDWYSYMTGLCNTHRDDIVVLY